MITDLMIYATDIPSGIWTLKHTQFNDVLELGKVILNLGTAKTYFIKQEHDNNFLQTYSRHRLVSKASLGEKLAFSKVAIEYLTRMWNSIDSMSGGDDYKRHNYRQKVCNDSNGLLLALINSIMEIEQAAFRTAKARAEHKYRDAKRAKFDEAEKKLTGKALRDHVRKRRAWESKEIPDEKLEYTHDNSNFAKFAVQLVELWAELVTCLWKRPEYTDEFHHETFFFLKSLVEKSFHPSQVDQLVALMRPYFGVYNKLTQRWLEDSSYAKTWNSNWSSGITAVTKSLANMKENKRLPESVRIMADKSINTIVVQYFFVALKKLFPEFHSTLIVSLSEIIPELVSGYTAEFFVLILLWLGSHSLLGHVHSV